MNETIKRIEKFAQERDLSLNKVSEGKYWVKHETSIIQITAYKEKEKENVDFICVIAQEVKTDISLMKNLLKANLLLPYGAFALLGNNVILRHSILGGKHMDIDEFYDALYNVAFIADEYEEKIIQNYGGKTGVAALHEILTVPEEDDSDYW